MSAASIAYHTSLGYTFPIYDNTIEVLPNVPKDVILNQTLRLPKFNEPEPPTKVKSPMYKKFNNDIKTYRKDPLAELLYSSRNQINEYLARNYRVNNNNNHHNNNSDNDNRLVERSTIKITKRDAKINIINDQSVRKTTPITNKTIFFSPSGKGKRSSTPISKDLQTLLRRKSSKNLKQRLLKMDQASMINNNNNSYSNKNNYYQEKETENMYNNDADDSDYDHLACHAENILRMAVDSTMLGSTINSSFSSSFSNSFSNDMQGKDFFDKEAKRTILEGLNF